MLYQLVINPVTLLILTLFSGFLVTPGLYITAPESGDVVEGVIEIRGSVPEEAFSSAEVLYAYEQAEVETWFLITRLDKVVQDDVLATWDTTTITDGEYRIKLVMKTASGNEYHVIVEHLQVSNYSRVQDQTPGASEIQTGQTSASAAIRAATAAPEENKVNPASIEKQDAQLAVVSGIITALAVLGLLVIYSSIQSRQRRR